MANRLNTICVLREIEGKQHYVPATCVADFEDGEPMFRGLFDTDIEVGGGYRVCLPVGEPEVVAATACVMREVRPGDTQWVPVREVPFLNPGEVIRTGLFASQVENLGPHKSHRRTICLQTGVAKETVAE